MRLTKRGRKRLIIVGAVLGVLAIGGGVTVALRGVYKSRVAERAREDGLTAYAAGDYEAALLPLSNAVSYRKDDLDAVLAFADARSRIVQVNGDHHRSAVMLFNAASTVSGRPLGKENRAPAAAASAMSNAAGRFSSQVGMI